MPPPAVRAATLRERSAGVVSTEPEGAGAVPLRVPSAAALAPTGPGAVATGGVRRRRTEPVVEETGVILPQRGRGRAPVNRRRSADRSSRRAHPAAKSPRLHDGGVRPRVRLQRGGPRNRRIRRTVAAIFSPASWHSQTVSADQPSFISRRACFTSRLRFRSSFRRQNAGRVVGIERPLRQRCRCQKQP